MQTDNLGAWSGDDFKHTLDNNIGTAYYSDRDDFFRFTHGVAKIIRRRLAMAGVGSEAGNPSVFILGPVPDHLSIKATKVPRLNSGKSKLAGHVWFLSREPISGNGFEANFSNDVELYDFVDSSLQAGEMPAILFDEDESDRMVRVYYDGLRHVDHCDELVIDTNDVTPVMVKTIIDKIHQTRLITPEAGDNNLNLWTDKAKHQPIKYPEAMIQSHLVTGISVALIACKVKKEQTGISGRYDIAIEEQDPANPSHRIQHAILELKVIKSLTSSGKPHSSKTNLSWLKSGMEQAHCYQEENGSKFSAVCCFDLQKVDEGEICFDHIRGDAKKLSIGLWRWYIYASSKAYRSAITVIK